MKKQNKTLIPLLAIGVVVLLGYKGFDWQNGLNGIDLFHPIQEESTNDAWAVFQNYLQSAKNHDLPGIRSLSYQISATCNDPTKEKECFALMDSVYSFASPFKLSDFKHIQSDERQVIMYTDGPTVATLYFVKNNGLIKVLGMRFCFEDEQTVGTCVNTGSIRNDSNGNGWWDSVESIFY